MDNRTQELVQGVWRVEVGYATNTYVIANDGRGDAAGLTVVDTGTTSGGPRLVRSIRMLGLDPRAVEDVLLTHWHRDHCGSAARFAASSAAPRVWIGHGDRAVVSGEASPVIPPPSDATPPGRVFARVNRPGPPVAGVRGLSDGARLEAIGGIEVVATPGHTAGHVAYLLLAQGVLLAGDALLHVLRLSTGPRFLSSALSARRAGLERIAGLDFAVLGVGHGQPLTVRARERVAALIG